MTDGYIRMGDGSPAVHHVADGCGHPYKVPTWALDKINRDLCDNCSTPDQRDAWDNRLGRLARPQRAAVVICDTAQLRSHRMDLPRFTACQCCDRWARHDSDYCSPKCERLSRFEPRTCTHPDCDTVYRSGYANQRCCTPKHNRALYRLEHPEQYPPESREVKRERWQRRRALKAGASTGAPVVLLDIAERDEWSCHLCHRPVDRNLAWPDSMSRSLDHVVPLSRGGAHDPSNVMLAHLRCNVAKGSTHAVEYERSTLTPPTQLAQARSSGQAPSSRPMPSADPRA